MNFAALDTALGIQDAHVMCYLHNRLRELRIARAARGWMK